MMQPKPHPTKAMVNSAMRGFCVPAAAVLMITLLMSSTASGQLSREHLNKVRKQRESQKRGITTTGTL